MLSVVSAVHQISTRTLTRSKSRIWLFRKNKSKDKSSLFTVFFPRDSSMTGDAFTSLTALCWRVIDKKIEFKRFQGILCLKIMNSEGLVSFDFTVRWCHMETEQYWQRGVRIKHSWEIQITCRSARFSSRDKVEEGVVVHLWGCLNHHSSHQTSAGFGLQWTPTFQLPGISHLG